MAENNESKEFLCNTSIIRSLLHYLSYSERRKAEEWLSKLQTIDDGKVDMETRNEYAFYLLINVQNGSMSEPFNKAPPKGKLSPLCRILPDFLYEDVMKQLKISYCRLAKMLGDSADTSTDPELGCEPDGFYSQQPRPRKGVAAHCVVFSNYESDKGGCK